MSHRTARRTAVIAAGALAGVLALAAPALAHVRVTPEEAAGGGFEKLTFRVPNESDSASTIKLKVSIPEQTPLASVSVQPVPGWKAEAHTTKLKKPVNTGEANLTEAVTSITWTAEKGAEIAPGEFQEFAISAGPLPEKGRLTLPAEQTYDDDKVVRWDEPTPEGGEEPEHPAPFVDLTPAADGHAHGGGMATATPAPAAAASTAGGADSGTRNLAVAGLVAGVIGLLAGVGGLVAGRRRRGGEQ
ncbi:MAG: DUF1775 domain-containing protein [Streptosporangiales bacterium]|nr:DUF1775 domain-containing protein [Streptosporangiales bacterium]